MEPYQIGPFFTFIGSKGCNVWIPRVDIAIAIDIVQIWCLFGGRSLSLGYSGPFRVCCFGGSGACRQRRQKNGLAFFQSHNFSSFGSLFLQSLTSLSSKILYEFISGGLRRQLLLWAHSSFVRGTRQETRVRSRIPLDLNDLPLRFSIHEWLRMIVLHWYSAEYVE